MHKNMKNVNKTNMYNQQVQPKVLVRPRSSLSTDEHHRLKPLNDKKNRQTSKTILTLIGLCIFLFTLCIFMTAALVFVGKSLVQLNLNNNSINCDFYENHHRQQLNIIYRNKNNKDNVIFNNHTINLLDTTEEILNYTPKIIFRLNNSSPSSERSFDHNTDNMTITSSTSATVSKIIQNLSFRLPKQIRPKYYKLYLIPNLDKKTFNGNVSIRLEILEPISYIPIHSKKLNITETSIYKILNNDSNENSENIDILQTFEYPLHEYWVTEFKNDLDIGEYSLNLSFNGSLINRIVGFYQSSYFDPKTGETRYIASSKFEPTYARQAFPCFDEPAMKAKFKVTIAKPSKDEYIALSNMDEEKQEVIGNVTNVHFKESVEMSTYVSCFIVCDFKYDSKEINTNGIGEPFNMRVFSTPGQIDKIKFALDTGVKVTEYYIQYFKIPYPLPKLDMIAIPDFVSGAMEHWGLVTFRETALLYNETISSTINKQRVGTTVAHELAHMWFGNLVTMKWWDDLWLNEGFATYLSFKGLDHAYPSWKMMDQFTVEEVHSVMNLDATTASHPIVQKVENPDQITELFDAITYQKGATIIRMLEDFVGSNIFQNAVTNYLTAFKYNNAITDDLLTKIGELESKIDVKYIMQTWTRQMGLPVVNVQKINESTYKLTQKRFFSNPEDENQQINDSPFYYKWYIPITYIAEGSDETNRIWFNNQDAEATINLDTPAKWIKLNKDQIGYYRINYPIELWKALLEVLKTNTTALSVLDRAHLLNDAFALADAEQLDYDIALDLTTYLENELDYIPWSVVSSKFLTLKGLLQYTNIYKDFVDYSRNVINNAYNTVGWNVDEDHLKNRLRTTILDLACDFEHPECMKEVTIKFKEFIKSPDNRPNPDIRTIVYYYGMISIGNEEIWDQIWQLFKDEQDANEKLKLMKALSGIQVPWILNRFIDLAWDESNVRGQDYFTCMAYIASNPIGENLVWNYVRENWQKLVDRFGLNERYLGRMIPSITSRFATKTRLKEMEAFFNEYPEAGAGAAARKQALQKTKTNIKWMEANKHKIELWLQECNKIKNKCF